MVVSANLFDAQFDHFRDSVRRASPTASEFRSFQEGLAAQWEDYKPRLREHALSLLDKAHWREDSVGEGVILNNVIASIEIGGGNDRNNLVRWVNKFGHANRSHHALLDARLDSDQCVAFERLFFDFFLDRSDDATVFEQLRALAGRRYDLLAYLFFLKDMTRFMPIATQTFDEAFALLGIDLVTTGQCSWENYIAYNNALLDVQNQLRERAGLSSARLIDAHSFCWMLIQVDKQISARPAPSSGPTGSRTNAGTSYDAQRISIWEMANAIEQTVRNSNGQVVERLVKNKELRMSRLALETHLTKLMEEQGKRCILTGIPFHFPRDPNCDKALLPSPDRIDSNGHYELGNIQLVCRFVNFWKSDSDNGEFQRLLVLVRGGDDAKEARRRAALGEGIAPEDYEDEVPLSREEYTRLARERIWGGSPAEIVMLETVPFDKKD